MKRAIAMEWIGAGLLTVAGGLVYLPLGIAILGVYLLLSAVLEQLTEGATTDGE